MDIKKLIGLLALAAAAGMLIMLFLRSQIVGLLIIALLALIGYIYFCD